MFSHFAFHDEIWSDVVVVGRVWLVVTGPRAKDKTLSCALSLMADSLILVKSSPLGFVLFFLFFFSTTFYDFRSVISNR